MNALLEENLYSSLTALPWRMRTADDGRKIQSLNLVLGCVNLLGNRLSSFLNSSSHLKRLSLALVQVTRCLVFSVLNLRKKCWGRLSLRGRRSKGKGKGIRARDHA